MVRAVYVDARLASINHGFLRKGNVQLEDVAGEIAMKRMPCRSSVSVKLTGNNARPDSKRLYVVVPTRDNIDDKKASQPIFWNCTLFLGNSRCRNRC